MSTYSDDTADRIRAFLASMQPRDGIDELAEYQRGREAVELLATCSKGDDPMPKVILPLSKCADILSFLMKLEPTESFLEPPGAPKFIEGVNWWADPEDAPSHVVGLQIVLGALEESIRRRVNPGQEASASNITCLSPRQPEGREEFSTLEAQLTLCRQTLMCATAALGKAEDDGFEGDTGPTAIRVIEQCVEDLLRFEQHLNNWYLKQRTTGVQS